MHNRALSNYIRERNLSKFGRILVITGARQTGKTTLVRRLFSDYPYLSIEDPVIVGQYTKLTAAQWHSNFPVAILDEVQKEPRLVESIKAVYDQFPEPRYILLGSSQIMLLKKNRESLAGRCEIIELFPLTLPEMLTKNWDDPVQYSWFQKLLLKNNTDNLPFLLDPGHVAKQAAFDYYLKFGGYPAISENTSEEDRYIWLNNYIRTYLERDVRDLADFRSLEPFTKIHRLMAVYTGQLTNFSQVAAEAGVTSKTVQRYLEYMSISYQTLVLQPWSRNAKKRLVKTPKVHFTDPGVLRAVLQKKGDPDGHQYESAIVAEIYKQLKTLLFPARVYHLRTSDGREIDLLIETENGYIAVEIKQSPVVRQADSKHLTGLEEILDKPVLHKFVLSNDMDTKDLNDGIKAMPAVKFLT